MTDLEREAADQDYQVIGLTFNEFFHELFMGILHSMKKEASLQEFLPEIKETPRD